MDPTQNERIRAAAWQAARGKLKGVPRKHGFCLQLVRLVVEAALELRSHELYDRLLIVGTTRRPGGEAERAAAARQDAWAADLEASMKRLGAGIPFADRRAGDLLFNYHAAEPFGHVAVLLDRDTVLENVNPAFRPASIHLAPALVLTPVEAVPWTLAARIPPLEGG